ncbi:MAG: lipoyl(octanoyl) transferase LipB [Verrucomicrobia bacterium]|jgi:lipoyl(octanoyl) transferase|nr:lipoyl(octanoyl) transferase LipB [Verrucomicrobiota bacterium]
MKLRVIDMGRAAFDRALALQEKTVAERKADVVPDTLILVEHDPVYTLGRNADLANVLDSPEALAARGIQLVPTTRGGQVTYHGPGQLVGYPVIDLAARNKGVLWYVEHLERVLMDVLEQFGLESHTDPKNRGVWIGDSKIAALGVRVTRHVTMHGFALNVAVNLEDYSGIVPCGIRDKGVTSLHVAKPDVTLDTVKPIVVDVFREVFEYE